MLGVLRNPTYSTLFSAQIIALLGTGLLTVALGLLAYDLAGPAAGAVLGTAYAIKMVAYVGLSPIAAALVERLPRKKVLVAADLIRAAVALFLPFIDEIWQIYVLIFVLQSASATFTPAFQAVIPDILTDEAEYTRALSLSRLAYDLENLLSPVLAGILLTLVTYHWLFSGTVVGFVVSALLVAITILPHRAKTSATRPFHERLTRGSRIYLATPRLRGLWALTLTAASASAFVLVNTVVLVRAGYVLTDTQVAQALAAYGGGSMVAALGLPRLLDHVPDRRVMVPAAFLLSLLMIGHAIWIISNGLVPWQGFLLLWLVMGLLYSAILTPSGRLLRRSAHSEDRPSIFAAQFALSHVCWLITYPIAGWAGNALGMGPAMLVLGGVALLGALFAIFVWPAGLPREVEHDHPDLPPDHPHLKQTQGRRHRHVFVIDDEHRVWPTHG